VFRVPELFNRENIAKLFESVYEDEYDDSIQSTERDKTLYGSEELVQFIKRNIKSGFVLEMGCGSGKSFEVFPITHAIEPNKYRIEQAKKRVSPITKCPCVEIGVAECLPWNDNYFDTVLMIGTLGHLRSMFETFMEVNRVLRPGGVFIFDTFEGYTGFPGLYPSANNVIEILKDFGFKLIERRSFEMKKSLGTRVGIAVEKIESFNFKHLRHLQVIRENNRYKLANFFPEDRDWNLL